ncbi:MAG TPA: cbb3-type cytochrome c oxidase N-terminal domain-containing protein [Opitutaceae bacterium]|nr:cbb3-type cytochrome c oxidase N-terminal domain-containing protein [Opitutaceae bacterium]
MTPTPTTPPEDTDTLRPHRYDGIQEYDKRLPNWWLFTLYGAIVFWIGYWGYYEWLKAGPSGPQRVERAMAEIEAARFAATPTLDDATLWKMSRNPVSVEAGRATFTSTCIACHLASLRGKDESPMAIGPNLTDKNWIHGGLPTQIYDTVTKGVLTKGMPAWGPVLGPKKITEVVAYVLSHHQEGEEIVLLPPDPAPAAK